MKSNVSDPVELATCIYIDAVAKCSAVSSDLRDLLTIKSRVEDEGISFLTITLPNFCKDFERALSEGGIDSTHFQGFRKCGAIPAFLQGMLSLIFNRETGRILDEHDDTPTLVESVRQVCLFFKKVEIPCTPERELQAIIRYTEVEQENQLFALQPTPISDTFRNVCRVLWDNMLGDLRPDMLLPRHGPGATSERILGNQKYVWRRWHERLEPFFPFFNFAYSYSAVDSREFQQVTFVPEQDEDPVRITLVPKTLKSPRIIAIEPVCMQYAQQAVQAALYERLETYWLTRGHVNFRDQVVNQQLAIESSRSGRLATIDLSDASDRVLLIHAEEMFRGNPVLWDAIEACRSRRAKLPEGQILSLSKFASMGSALCFPVEAMFFYTVCVVARLEKRNLPVTPRNVFMTSRDVYVYGDDLVVPVEDAEVVLDHLRKNNCKVNTAKTFYSGKFRESCGADAYNGSLVTPVYLRRQRPKNKLSVSELASWVASANALYLKGYWHTADRMFRTCESILGTLPYISPTSDGLGRVSVLNYRSIERWNGDHQVYESRPWCVKSVYSSDIVDGYPALQKCLLSLERRSRGIPDSSDWGLRRDVPVVVANPNHLRETARRSAVTLKRCWVPIT